VILLVAFRPGQGLRETDTEVGRSASGATPGATSTTGGEGARCGVGAGYTPCAAGLFCSSGICRGLSLEGQRCGAGTKPLCANGFVCSAKGAGEGICRVRVALGKACEGANPPCVQDLFCDMTTAAYICQRGE
jgi:hypothetical protein